VAWTLIPERAQPREERLSGKDRLSPERHRPDRIQSAESADYRPAYARSQAGEPKQSYRPWLSSLPHFDQKWLNEGRANASGRPD